ncbi:hypothetical protein H5410_031313 [Solanum commersonii]|uniref:Uncharacterized protein n=1 Tax=Solanum commersonii TaxID=4109 RepID=A0A9J5YJJ1_SOLCO|nr:hypothetical protein H5410_031313 [Solanum commersonii]
MDMANREIGMDPRESTSRSLVGQRDRFPLETPSESPVPLVPASPTPGNRTSSTYCSSTRDCGVGDEGGSSVAD